VKVNLLIEKKDLEKNRKKEREKKKKKGFRKSRFWDENNFTVGEWQALDDKAAKKGIIIIICMLSVLNIRKKRNVCEKREILTQK
jgi:hypothetical protein